MIQHLFSLLKTYVITKNRVPKSWRRLIFAASCPATIVSATAVNFWVRNGIRWFHCALVTKTQYSDNWRIILNELKINTLLINNTVLYIQCCKVLFDQSVHGRLNALQRFHRQPVIPDILSGVSRPFGQRVLIFGYASRLDAFSGYQWGI